jgi:polyisoprenoid-binding protein YceI
MARILAQTLDCAGILYKNACAGSYPQGATMSTTPARIRIDAPSGDYVLTNGTSSISFKTRHMYRLGPVKGHLSVRSGNLHGVEGHCRLRRERGCRSLELHDPQPHSRRSRPLPDVPGIKKNPTWTYESSSVVQEGEDLVVKGTFTVRGNSAPVSLIIDRVEAAPNGELMIHAHGEVDRYALGVTTLRGMAARLLAFDVETRKTA